MKIGLDDRLKQQFAYEFSLLYKNWEQKPYHVFAESAANKSQFAQLPVDMLLYSLDIRHEVKLRADIFDFLTYKGCEQYNDYIFEKLPYILQKIKNIELSDQHIRSLCTFVNKKLLKKGNVTEGIRIANLLLEKKPLLVRQALKDDLLLVLRNAARDDCKLSVAEIQQFIAFVEILNYRSDSFIEELARAKNKQLCFRATEALVAITEKVFPYIKKDVYDFYEYSDGCLFHYLKWNSSNIGKYVNENYETALTCLIKAIENENLSDDELRCAKHLLVALAAVYFERDHSTTLGKREVFYRLYSQSRTFRQAVNSYACFVPELLGELFFRAFTKLDKNIMEQIYEECVSQYPKSGDSYSCFTGTLPFKFINCFSNLPCWSEETCGQYFSLCKYIDTILPELNFKTHQAYGFFQSATEGLNGLLSLQPLLEKMDQGLFWINTENLPPCIEFDYTYPNGKNGDIIKFIFEEYGETSMKSGILWHGRIGSEYIELFGILYSAIPLTISEDPEFQKIFEYHIPTVIARQLSELVWKKANYFKSFREYQNLTLAYSKEQTRKRTELYSQLILQGQTSPKWKSEAQLFALVSSIYQDAIYQYRADWLHMQSLDIFIPSISVGIEYQGVQHYKPVDLFGGEEHFKHQQELDQKKITLCKQNGVTLLEWPYNKKITKENLEAFLQHDLR